MEFQLKIDNHENITTIKGDQYISLLDILKENQIFVSAPCNGKGKCGKCYVKATGIFSNVITGEKIKVRDKLIASCQYAPVFDCEITLPDYELSTIGNELPQITPREDEKLGFVVDIGTTSLEAALYDLKTGKCICKVHQPNKQAIFGADVISRIEQSKNGNFFELNRIIKQQIEDIACIACKTVQQPTNFIEEVVIVGNTIMQYFLAKLDPYQLAIPPFTVNYTFGDYDRYINFSSFSNNTKVYFADCLSAYIGGDVLSGCLYSKFENNDKLTLFIDLGTNGELVLGKSGRYYSCASAAGPAFEAETMSCGMQASMGAIHKVEINNSIMVAQTIGTDKAKGICGSGMIDAIACLLELNYIGKTGLIKKVSYYNKQNESCILLKDGVSISQSDVRNVLLAKGAIKAGIDILVKEYGCTSNDIEQILLAGNFGNYVNIDNCIKIGLLPNIPNVKIQAIGNSSLAGGCLLLNGNNKETLKSIKKSMKYIDLSTNEEFTTIFAQNLKFK